MSGSLPTTIPKKYLRIARLRERYDCSDEWIRRAMRDRAFPQPVTFGGRDRFWLESELDAWDAQQIAQAAPRKGVRP